MFKVEKPAQPLPEFNANRLVLKFDKKAISNKTICPETTADKKQLIEPEEPAVEDHMFEIY